MRWDRLFVLVVAAVFMTWANVAPNTFPQAEYGRGFPLKYTYDPRSTPSANDVNDDDDDDDTPPYQRRYAPRKYWAFDQTALVIDILVALAAIGAVLGVNELVQVSAGNRSPAIPPNA